MWTRVNKGDSVLMNNKRRRLEGPGRGAAGDKQRGGEDGRLQGTAKETTGTQTTRETGTWEEGTEKILILIAIILLDIRRGKATLLFFYVIFLEFLRYCF